MTWFRLTIRVSWSREPKWLQSARVVRIINPRRIRLTIGYQESAVIRTLIRWSFHARDARLTSLSEIPATQTARMKETGAVTQYDCRDQTREDARLDLVADSHADIDGRTRSSMMIRRHHRASTGSRKIRVEASEQQFRRTYRKITTVTYLGRVNRVTPHSSMVVTKERVIDNKASSEEMKTLLRRRKGGTPVTSNTSCAT